MEGDTGWERDAGREKFEVEKGVFKNLINRLTFAIIWQNRPQWWKLNEKTDMWDGRFCKSFLKILGKRKALQIFDR